MNTDSTTNSTTRSASSNLFSFSSLSGKTYLFAVLNWGLGHATRSIPFINELLNNGIDLEIASDGDALELLKKEFSGLKFHVLPSYRIRYGSSIWSIVFNNSFRVLSAIIREHFWLKKMLRSDRYDGVISDSRFGFYSKHVPCYIISHQLSIPIRNVFLNKFVNRINAFFLNRFTSVLIPDDPGVNLSGKMSENRLVRRKEYLGIRSRLSNNGMHTAEYDLALLLSGPEPSRTHLEKSLISKYKDSDKVIVLVRGTNAVKENHIPSHWTVYDLASSDVIIQILLSSRHVISRSGYSSVLDYYSLGISATLIPTPGQAEHEYLALSLNGKHGFNCVREEEINELTMDD